MSTNCPPQLQLSIQPNTTSFKRSFEQFGFDLGSPVGSGAGAHTAETFDLRGASAGGGCGASAAGHVAIDGGAGVGGAWWWGY